MTDQRRVTDEQLTEIEARANGAVLGPPAANLIGADIPLLIADLRASRAREAEQRQRDFALHAEIAALRQRIDNALAGHRLEQRQAGSKTHGGGPEYADWCVKCRTWGCPLRAALTGTDPAGG